ncbi:MAG: hypothetical protein ACPG6R_11020 [Aequoribacter sp.]
MFDLWRATEGKLGLSVLDCTPMVDDAMRAVAEGIAIRVDAEGNK